MTKVPEAKSQEKEEPLKSDGSGVGPEIEGPPPIFFAKDHQIPNAEPDVDPWKGKLEGGRSPTVSEKFGGF